MNVTDRERQQAIVNRYGPLMCEDCKKKIEEQAAKISKMSLLAPIRLAHKFRKMLCHRCLMQVVKEAQKK